MSTIVTDTLQGKTSATSITLPTTTNIGSTPLVSASANSMTIRGEGSAVTNIQQGLCKAFVEGNDAAAFTLSFNISSGSDDGTGDYSYNFTNNLGSADMVMVGVCGQNASSFVVNNQRSASLFGIKLFTDGGSLADRDHNCSVHGDLA